MFSNNVIFYKVLLAILETFAYFAVGGFAVWRKYIPKEALPSLSRFTVNVLTPFLIFFSITKNFSADDVDTLWIYPVAAFAMIVFHAICGLVLVWFLKHPENGRKETFLHMMAVNNFLYLPLIVVSHLWGGKYIGAVMLWSVGSIIGQWTVGVAVMADGSFLRLLKNLFTTNILAVILAVICVFCRWQLPPEAMMIIQKLGEMSIPLGMILIGTSIFASGAKLLAIPGDMIFACVARLIIIPLLTAGVLYFIKMPEMLRHLAVVVSVMPGAVASVLIVREFGGDSDFAGQLVLTTTCAGLFTLPLALSWLL